MVFTIHSDVRSAIQIASALSRRGGGQPQQRRLLGPISVAFGSPSRGSSAATAERMRVRVRAFSTDNTGIDEVESVEAKKLPSKPSVCTADELHYVSANNSDWRLALWRYIPPPQAPKRNHPLLLLSGVGTNAIGYDLSPGSSFARYMCGQGFDTWILEVRGAGLSLHESDSKNIEKSAHKVSERMEAAVKSETNGNLSAAKNSRRVNGNLEDSDIALVKEDPMKVGTAFDESRLVARLTETFMRQIRDLSQKLVNIIEEGQRSVSPPLFDLQERLISTIEDFQKQLDLIIKYDWDFDNYLEEDVPAAMEYINAQTKPKDGKLLAIGHSMGGILLYARLSRCATQGKDPGLAAVVTLASSLDYTPSKSALRLLLPLADPAQALNVPVVPLGSLLTAAYPLTSSPPYVLSWLNDMISAGDMMHPELLKKLVQNNFCTIPAKLLLQLTTAFREGGLRDRSGKFLYKEHLRKSNVPVLALAGDRDLICPPEAVYETIKVIPEHLATYKLFGEPDGPHYAHYDLVGCRVAAEQIYPCIVQYLSRYDL
nr:N-formylmaleamate deformylase [Ipomoea batatas]